MEGLTPQITIGTPKTLCDIHASLDILLRHARDVKIIKSNLEPKLTTPGGLKHLNLANMRN